MIIDSIKNAEKYCCLHPLFKKAFEELSKLSADTADGSIEIDGQNAHIGFSGYVNKNISECSFEVHEKYIDIQYMVSGEERIDITAASALKCTENRLEADDIAFFEAPQNYSSAHLTDGIFAIIFPGEAHRPCIAPCGTGKFVKKAVAKIKEKYNK